MEKESVEYYKAKYGFKKIFNALTSTAYHMLVPTAILIVFVKMNLILLAVVFTISWIGVAFPFKESL